MSVSRKLGILVFFAVPAIIGGGITYAIFHGNYIPVYFMEIIYRCSFMRSFFCRLPAFFSASDTRSRLNLQYQFDYRHGPDLLLNG
jgi:hypothetical protein